ncbi:MAG: hypothetical protein QW520_04490 [Methanomassiliicoccales archaeon]
MKWRNHFEIAMAIAEELQLPPRLKNILKLAIIQPDREAEKVLRLNINFLPHRKRVRHHRPSRRFLRHLIWKAREAFLQGREEDAVWCLGRALHYIHDGSVAAGPLYVFHHRREKALEKRRVDFRAVRIGAERSLPSPLFVDMCLRLMKPRRDPKASMYQACMLSSAISHAVLAWPCPQLGLRYELKQAEKRHKKLILPLAYVSSFTSSFCLLILGQVQLLPLTALLALGILRLDSSYYFYQREAQWFQFER